MSSSNRQFPASSGSYLLILYLRKRTTVRVGRLGSYVFRRGWYFYSGSAFGPGGLKARLGHHRKPPRRYHWHIDYLRPVAELRMIWFQVAVNNEHLWCSSLLSSLPECSIPVAKFGSSDCHCASHLVYLSRWPGANQVRLALGAGPTVETIFCERD